MAAILLWVGSEGRDILNVGKDVRGIRSTVDPERMFFEIVVRQSSLKK